MQSYLITSREFYTDTPAVFRSILHEQLQKHLPTYALFRDKSNQDYDMQAEYHVQVCSQFENTKSFLHQKPDLAKKLGANGVHLNSKQFDLIMYAKSLELEVIVSTHTYQEVIEAETLGADAVVYGPIFSTPGKGEAKGVDDLKALVEKTNIRIFGLGGIVDKDKVTLMEATNTYGFASIGYFTK